MLTRMDFEMEAAPRMEMAPTVFTVVNHRQKSNVYSPWIELPHFISNITSASSEKERTLKSAVEETSSVLNFWMLCELTEPNPDHSI